MGSVLNTEGDSQFSAAIHCACEASTEKLSRWETKDVLQLLKNARYASNSQALRTKVAGLLTNKSLPRENEFDEAIIVNVVSILSGDVDDLEQVVLDLRHFNGKEGTQFKCFLIIA